MLNQFEALLCDVLFSTASRNSLSRRMEWLFHRTLLPLFPIENAQPPVPLAPRNACATSPPSVLGLRFLRNVSVCAFSWRFYWSEICTWWSVCRRDTVGFSIIVCLEATSKASDDAQLPLLSGHKHSTTVHTIETKSPQVERKAIIIFLSVKPLAGNHPSSVSSLFIPFDSIHNTRIQ